MVTLAGPQRRPGQHTVSVSAALSYAHMREPAPIRGRATSMMSLLMVVIGVALIVRTLVAGGGVAATGLILGILFAAAGLGRLYIQRMTR
jgi:hypothetical protein